MQFTKLALALLPIAFTSVRADYNSVSSNIAQLGDGLVSLNNQLWSSSVATYSGALRVDSAARSLATKMQSAADSTAKEPVFALAPSNALVAQVQALLPGVRNATGRVAALEPTFERMGVAGIAKADVNKLASAMSSFASALVQCTPTQNRPQASALANQFNGAMAYAVAAYA